MAELIRRLVLALFPELASGYLKPMLGRIQSISKAPVNGETCTHEEPYYAVDIQPLDAHFKDQGPLLRDVVVAVPYAGAHRGFFALPDAGCIVEFCFSYALPHLIHIRGTIPWGLPLPSLDQGEAKWQHNANNHQGYDKNGNWHRHTTENITDHCQKIHTQIAEMQQVLKSPRTWIGSESENALAIVSQFMATTADALKVLATHTHKPDGLPAQGPQMSQSSSAIKSQKNTLDQLTAS